MEKMEEKIRRYLDICRNEKRLSEDTLKAYRGDLRQFAIFVAGREIDRKLLSLYMQYLNKAFAPRSAKRKMASIRAFFREMYLNE